jgi:ribosome-binding factor A
MNSSTLDLGITTLKKTPVRQLRVAELIKHAMSEILLEHGSSNEILQNNFITISRVKISPDLLNTTIFISCFKAENNQEVVKILNQLSPKFRFILSNKIKLKSSPYIIFRYDDSLENEERINKLLT